MNAVLYIDTSILMVGKCNNDIANRKTVIVLRITTPLSAKQSDCVFKKYITPPDNVMSVLFVIYR